MGSRARPRSNTTPSAGPCTSLRSSSWPWTRARPALPSVGPRTGPVRPRRRCRTATGEACAQRAWRPRGRSPLPAPSRLGAGSDRPSSASVSADLVILDGTTYFISELNGDIRIRRAEGLVHGDVRHLSTWELTVDGAPLEALASEPIEHQRARIFCWPRGGVKGVLIRRDRLVADGVHEDVEVQNLSEEEVRIRLRFRFGSDFADIFQIQRGRQPPGRLVAELASDQVLFRREGQGIARGTRIQFEPAPTAIGKRTARFDVALPPRGTWRTCVDVVAVVGNEERPARIPCRAGEERARPQLPVGLNDWLGQAPPLGVRRGGVGPA